MIDSYSSFLYDYIVTAEPYNGFINIDEGSGPFTITVPVGSYTFTTLVDALRNALLTQGTLDYVVTSDRVTRLITISADQNFDLLTNSGPNSGSALWPVIGFSQAADKTGSDTYTSDLPTGRLYCPQFPLQSYVPPELFRRKNQSSKNIASDGTTVEVINFGLAVFIEFDIKFITSRLDISDGVFIRNNPTGLEDALEFLNYITDIAPFEFMPDLSLPGNFYNVILESITEFQDGTGFKLRELFNRNLRDVYETGIIRLRVVQ